MLRMVSEALPITLMERQKYLESLGRYIDLLFKCGENYVIVELKNRRIDDEPTVLEQIIPYRVALALELGIPEDRIVCVLVSPEGFSPDIESLCKRHNVLTKTVDYSAIREAQVRSAEKSLLSSLDTQEEEIVLRVLVRRGVEFSKVLQSDEEVVEEVASAKTWSRLRIHDDNGMKQIAARFKDISQRAPLMAHEVRTGSNG